MDPEDRSFGTGAGAADGDTEVDAVGDAHGGAPHPASPTVNRATAATVSVLLIAPGYPDPMPEVVELRLDEANELLSAWATQRASERAIRILVIKGRSLSHYGLRPPRTSADVDVLVEPARFGEYCNAILDAGWAEIPGTFASDALTLHSRSFRRTGWPNSFDVHSYYPGFLVAPHAAFDALWARRGTLEFAHRECPVPDRASSILILALHSLRGADQQPRHRDELAAVMALTLTEADRADLAAAARETGADVALRDILPVLGVSVDVSSDDLRTPQYREWHRKTVEAHGAAASWLSLFGRSRWQDKPRVLWKAVWPSRDDFAITHPEVPDRWSARARARVTRWGRGIRHTPSSLAAMLRK